MVEAYLNILNKHGIQHIEVGLSHLYMLKQSGGTYYLREFEDSTYQLLIEVDGYLYPVCKRCNSIAIIERDGFYDILLTCICNTRNSSVGVLLRDGSLTLFTCGIVCCSGGLFCMSDNGSLFMYYKDGYYSCIKESDLSSYITHLCGTGALNGDDIYCIYKMIEDFTCGGTEVELECTDGSIIHDNFAIDSERYGVACVKGKPVLSEYVCAMSLVLNVSPILHFTEIGNGEYFITHSDGSATYLYEGGSDDESVYYSYEDSFTVCDADFYTGSTCSAYLKDGIFVPDSLLALNCLSEVLSSMSYEPDEDTKVCIYDFLYKEYSDFGVCIQLLFEDVTWLSDFLFRLAKL